jgi:peptide/nickel transport system permease protein/dipeptide transport system permease protein
MGLKIMKSRFWLRFSKNRFACLGGALTLVFVLIAIFAPILSPHDPAKADLNRRLQHPIWMKGGDWKYPLGCDQLGRDLLSRIIYGSRISIFIGVAAVSASALIGMFLGILSGYYGGKIDAIISTMVDILLAFPLLVFAIALMAAAGPGIGNIIAALTYKGWVPFCRLVRGDALIIKQQEYIEAAIAYGASELRIMLSGILPNVVSSVIVLASLNIATVIIMEASLSFLGLGVQPPTPAWGSMVNEGRIHLLTGWWVSICPGMAILVLTLSINFLGQGLRDALAPQLGGE